MVGWEGGAVCKGKEPAPRTFLLLLLIFLRQLMAKFPTFALSSHSFPTSSLLRGNYHTAIGVYPAGGSVLDTYLNKELKEMWQNVNI